MPRYFKFIVTTALICSSQLVFATGECDKYTTPYDRTYCFAKLFVESDRELNVVYKELQGKLKSKAKQSLTEVQRDWLSYRDIACQPNQGTIIVDCNYAINRDRTIYLRDRLTECKAGTCREDMIGSKSWN